MRHACTPLRGTLLRNSTPNALVFVAHGRQYLAHHEGRKLDEVAVGIAECWTILYPLSLMILISDIPSKQRAPALSNQKIEACQYHTVMVHREGARLRKTFPGVSRGCQDISEVCEDSRGSIVVRLEQTTDRG